MHCNFEVKVKVFGIPILDRAFEPELFSGSRQSARH